MRFDLEVLLAVRIFVEYDHGRVGKNARRPRVAWRMTPVNIVINGHDRAGEIWQLAAVQTTSISKRSSTPHLHPKDQFDSPGSDLSSEISQ